MCERLFPSAVGVNGNTSLKDIGSTWMFSMQVVAETITAPGTAQNKHSLR